MEAIAIVELPIDAFDNDGSWGDGKWMIDDEGAIRYLDDNVWVHYKDIGGIELRPMPEKLDIHSWFEKYHSGGDVETRDAKCYGWNKCLDELLGENDD